MPKCSRCNCYMQSDSTYKTCEGCRYQKRQSRKAKALERAQALWKRAREVGYRNLSEEDQRAFMRCKWGPSVGY